MCNLSEGIEKRGEKRGWDLGKQDDVLEMLKDGVPFEKLLSTPSYPCKSLLILPSKIN